MTDRYLCIGYTNDNSSWYIYDEYNHACAIQHKDIVRNYISSGNTVVNTYIGQNGHLYFQRVFADNSFKDVQFLSYIIESRLNYDIIPILFNYLRNIDQQNSYEYTYFKSLLDKILRLYLKYMTSITINGKETVFINKTVFNYLSSYLSSNDINYLVQAEKLYGNGFNIYKMDGIALYQDFLSYIYNQSALAFNTNDKVLNINENFVTVHYKKSLIKEYKRGIIKHTNEVCSLIKQNLDTINTLSRNALHGEYNLLHFNNYEDVLDDEKLEKRIKASFNKYVDSNLDSENKDKLCDFIQICIELCSDVNESLGKFAKLAKDFKDFKETYISSRYINVLGSEKLFLTLEELYKNDLIAFIYFIFHYDKDKNVRKVHDLPRFKKLMKKFYSLYNKGMEDKSYELTQEAQFIMQSNLFSFKIYNDFFYELAKRYFLQINLWGFIREYEFYNDIVGVMSDIDVADWWLKTLYIVNNYFPEELSNNRVLFGVVFRDYVRKRRDNGLVEKDMFFYKLSLEDVDKLLCNWLSLKNNFWVGINAENYLR